MKAFRLPVAATSIFATPIFQRRRGMSLIEILVVMAIVGAMAALLIPAVNNFGKSNALTAEGNRVHGVIELARQNSLSKNALTAFVVNTTPGSDGNMRSYSIWELTPTSDGKLPDWKQISRWETLRDGVVISDLDPDSWKNDPLSHELPSMQYQGKAVTSFAFRIFRPSGALWGSNAGNIKLIEGFVSPGASGVTPTHASNGVPANTYEVAIIPTTGRTKISRN